MRWSELRKRGDEDGIGREVWVGVEEEVEEKVEEGGGATAVRVFEASLLLS